MWMNLGRANLLQFSLNGDSSIPAGTEAPHKWPLFAHSFSEPRGTLFDQRTAQRALPGESSSVVNTGTVAGPVNSPNFTNHIFNPS